MALRSSSATAEAAGTLVSGDVRRHNLSIVARYLLENGPSSRSQIADGTGLTRGSVTALAAVLLDAAIIHEASPENARGKGRPLTLLSLAADHVAILALQLDADQGHRIPHHHHGRTAAAHCRAARPAHGATRTRPGRHGLRPGADP